MKEKAFKDRAVGWFRAWLPQAAGLDLRSLACARIAFGVIILLDLAVRSSALKAHYTDLGIMPVEVYHQMGVPFTLSLHAMSGEVRFQAVLFLINALAAVALLLGWRTRLATLVCWIFLISLHNRNFLLLNGGDTWMRNMFFWAVFLPWGDRWSYDARSVAKPGNHQVLSSATAGYCMQIFWVYIMAGMFKTGAAWWHEGSATLLTLELAEWTGELAYYGLYYPTLLKYLTFSVLVFELIGPFLFFAPFATQHLRIFSILGFFSFHLGLAIFIEIGIFPYVGMIAVCTLLPGLFWNLSPVKKLEKFLDKLWSFRGLEPPRRRPYYRPGATTNTLLAVVILYVALWNAGSWKQAWAPAARAQVPGYLLGFDQYWGLFAPEPPRNHNWFLAVATLSDGRQIDLIRDGKPLHWDKPTSSTIYKNQRWKRMLVSMSNDFGRSTRKPFLRYLYRKWLPLHPDIQDIELIRMVQESRLDFEEVPPQKAPIERMSREEFLGS